MVPVSFGEYFELQCKLLKKENRGRRSDLRSFASSLSFPSLLVSSSPGHLESTVYSCTCSSPSLGKACLRHRRSKPSIIMVWTSAWIAWAGRNAGQEKPVQEKVASDLLPTPAQCCLLYVTANLLKCHKMKGQLKLDYEQSPIFPQGQQSERNASARENHPTREKASRGIFLSPCRVSPFLAWGDFLSLRKNRGLLVV